MIERIVKLSIQADKATEFVSIFNTMQSRILSMPGCHSVRLLHDINAENVFFTHSIWDDSESLDAYRNSDLFRNTWQHVKTLFDDKPAAWSVHIIKN